MAITQESLLYRTCENPECDKTFEVGKYQHRRKYCSRNCRDRVSYLRISPKKMENRSKVYHDRRKKRKLKALSKLANGGPVQCAICGCPYEEGLHVGHINHDGAEHRKEHGNRSRYIHKWILATPLKEVLERVRIECVYCNFIQNYTGKYPSVDRRPRW